MIEQDLRVFKMNMLEDKTMMKNLKLIRQVRLAGRREQSCWRGLLKMLKDAVITIDD